MTLLSIIRTGCEGGWLVRTDPSCWSLSLLFTKFSLSIYCLMTITRTYTHT